MGKGKLILSSEDAHEQKIEQSITEPQKTKKKIKKPNKPQQIQPIEQTIQEQSSQKQIQIEQQVQQQQQDESQTEKLIKLKHLAIAIPDSILELPQTSQLRAYFIGQIARICSIFKVDEIIVLKDHSYIPKSENFSPSEYMVRNLQYLETPQYLKKHLFKHHSDLKNVGLMNPIQCQHHLKTHEVCEYRQGVVLDRPPKKGFGSWVDIGLKQQARMNELLLPLTRVTLKLSNFEDPDAPFYEAKAVSKRVPRQEKGMYWGYDVRIAKNLKDMFKATNSAIKSEQYDIKLLCNHTKESYKLPEIDHFYQISEQLQSTSVLIFFAGTDDLQTFIEKDIRSKMSKEDAIEMFDCCMKFEGSGVKQLRIEEQLFITLSKIFEYTP